MNIREIAQEVAGNLFYVHDMKPGSAIIGLPVLYPDGGRVVVYISSDRPGLFYVSDFEGGRKRALMEGVEESFDRAIRETPADPPLVIEGLSVYVRTPREQLAETVTLVANASADALSRALWEKGRQATGKN